MKLNRKPVFWGIFGALLLGVSSSDALTLGRVRGAVLLGQVLDLSVLVQYADEEDVSSGCFHADVQYGDTPLESSLIVVKAQAGPQPNSQLVRIISNSAVDEALVRLTLRAVCSPKASRQYILLSDVASELAGAATVARAAPRTDTAERAASSNTAAGTDAVGKGVTALAPVAPVPVQTKTAAATPKQPAALAARPTLRLAAPSDKPGKGAGAKASTSLNTAALEELQRRVDDIAKWQTNSASAEDLLKSEARATALEADIRGLQVVTAKNQQSIQMVAAALESNSAQNYGRPLAYGLGALLLGCLAALAYMVQRMRSGGFAAAPWWSGQTERPQSQTAAAIARATEPGSIAAAQSLPGELAQTPAQTQNAVLETGSAALEGRSDETGAGTVSMDIDAEAQAAATAAKHAVAERAKRPDFAPSAPGNMKSINTKEMLDVRQQAEFFMALGQHDEAVRLLESSIHGSADCNPLVFLDLLKIFHTLSRRADFERYREEFNAQFTGRIPPYASFLSEGNGLDAYVDICNQIVVLWPTEYTIDYIEQCLVRLPEDDPEQGMDLEAFKDLLLLYGVLKRLDQGYDSNLAPFSASRSDPPQNDTSNGGLTAPLPVMPAAGYGAATPPMDIDIDIDLNPDELGTPLLSAAQNNLIDFDMSDYIAQKKSDSAT